MLSFLLKISPMADLEQTCKSQEGAFVLLEEGTAMGEMPVLWGEYL